MLKGATSRLVAPCVRGLHNIMGIQISITRLERRDPELGWSAETVVLKAERRWSSRAIALVPDLVRAESAPLKFTLNTGCMPPTSTHAQTDDFLGGKSA